MRSGPPGRCSRRATIQCAAVRILFAGIPAYGHLYPLMPLFLACAERGHDVEMATGPPVAGRLRVPTVPVGSWTTLDDAEAEVKRRHPEVADLPPPERYRFGIELFAHVGAGHFAEALIELLEAQRPDLVVYEATAVGAGVAAQITGIPAVAHGVVRWGFFTAALHQTVLERQRDSWTRRQLQPPPIDGVLADCFLDLTPAALGDDSAPLPARTLPIRPVPWNEQLTAVPDWLAEPRQRPRVYVTLGTVVFSYVDALRTAVEGAANLGADVLVTVGPEGDPAGLGRLGDNVHVERFAPQSEVL